MANLARWDPFDDMVTLRDAMGQLFENALIDFRPWQTTGTRQGATFPVDVTENDDNYMVKASLPGLKPEDLDVTVQENVVTIKGEIKAEEENKDERYHVRERRWGSFQRSIMLPTGVDANNVQADYENGILKLTLPKTQEAKPRRIQIQGGGRTLEGQSKQVNVSGGGRGGSQNQGS